MTFSGNEGQVITLAEGAELTARHRMKYPNGGLGVAYGSELIQQLLDNPGCVGVRMYFAQESDGSQTVVLVGVDETGNDLLNLIVENGIRCPNFCGDSNALNSSTKEK